MADDPIAQLSDTQKACLRLVAVNRSSKEIAQATGLSHQTVDQYISRAAATLGASNRRDAARKLVELESEQFSKSEFKVDTVAATKKSPIKAGSTGQGYTPGKPSWLAKWIPSIGGTRHDLTSAGIVQTILRISFLSMGTVAAIIAIVFWLNRLML